MLRICMLKHPALPQSKLTTSLVVCPSIERVEAIMKKLSIDWRIKPSAEDVKPVVIKYRRYLQNVGLRNSAIEAHTIPCEIFLCVSLTYCPA
jgi:hypothetical protein